MESEQRVSRKGRKLGSSRRRQMREAADSPDAPVAPEPESWPPQAAAELQAFFQDCGAKERGFVTREDLAVAKFTFLGSEDELEMIFDWVDVEQKGRLSLEDFSSGLKNIFGSGSHGLRRKRPVPSKRESAATSFPVLEEADPEEKEAFFAFVQQLGAGHLPPEQAEVWQLWRELRREEPQLAGNLEGFLARVTSRLREAQADKEALELTLQKRDSEHHREVQRLYEEAEQQILREKQRLQAESDSRGLAFSTQMQEVLEAKEREYQRLTEGQKQLEAQLHHLSDSHQAASAENQQLREAERDLAGQLEEVQGRLRETRGQLNAARGHVSWQMEDEPSVPRAGEEKVADTEAVSSEEAPLPELFGDEDAWAAPPGEQGTLPSRAENRPEDPGTACREAGPTPSPGPLAAAAAAGEPPADPDHLFHVIFLGDSNVGKTSFLHLLHQNTFNPGLTATVGVDFRVKTLLVDNKWFALQLWDTAGQERYHSMTRQLLRKADGVVLMYDVTSQESFTHVRYWLDCLQVTQDAGGPPEGCAGGGDAQEATEESWVLLLTLWPGPDGTPWVSCSSAPVPPVWTQQRQTRPAQFRKTVLRLGLGSQGRAALTLPFAL
ncbi:ras-related protein Rab-44 isoform X3 [Hyaena hyaena]|uniref:ras-related protein Rab-44 isoform X3 n=1 Tax=Hyaena hyaena TaxID=95912 RepID=UPI001920AB64|nr:ras-related protein Rab-44 isoform X3 [Hyaena hyaena]